VSGIVQRPLFYTEALERRSPDAIRLAVIHATELPDLATAREYGERVHYPDSGTGNSGHFYVDRDGHVEQWVPLDRVAHHVRGHNADSVGIELVNFGRWPNWYASDAQAWSEPYSRAQIQAVIELLNTLKRELPALAEIAGHDQLDRSMIEASDAPRLEVRRKLDPGPEFPWPEVLEETGLRRLPPESATP